MSDSRGLAPVTVIGLGPMGRAMAATLMRAGHPVTLWNRTPSRADELVAAGELSTALMMGATADHIVRTSEQAGIGLQLPKAVKAHYDQAIAAGHGTENWTVLYEVIKARR